MLDVSPSVLCHLVALQIPDIWQGQGLRITYLVYSYGTFLAFLLL